MSNDKNTTKPSKGMTATTTQTTQTAPEVEQVHDTPNLDDIQALAGAMKNNGISSQPTRIDFKEVGARLERSRTPIGQRLEELPFLISAGVVMDGEEKVWGNWHLQAPKVEGRKPVLSFHIPVEQTVTSVVRGKKVTNTEQNFERTKVRLIGDNQGPSEALEDLLSLDRLPHFGTMASVMQALGQIEVLWDDNN